MKRDKSKNTEAARQTDLGKRRWNDFKEKEYIQGPFTPEEVETLKKTLCKYALNNNLTEDELRKLIVDSLKSKSAGIWSKVAEEFPDRTVQSIQNICKRRFNPHNYKGKWTEAEVKKLIELVEVQGRKWVLIGQILERTPTNVRDKWREIGEENFKRRKAETVWSIEDSIRLVSLIEKQNGVKLIPVEELKAVVKEYKARVKEISENEAAPKSKVLNSLLSEIVFKRFNKEGLKSILKGSINWRPLSKEMISKSKDDCKNHWQTQILKPVWRTQKALEYKHMLSLIAKLKNRNFESEDDIDWESTGSGGKQTWKKMKKIFKMEVDLVSYLDQCEEALRTKSEKKFQKFQTDEDKNELLEMYRATAAKLGQKKIRIKD
jgi:hypothetical protein